MVYFTYYGIEKSIRFRQKSDLGDIFHIFRGGFQRHMQSCLSHMPLRVKCISMVISLPTIIPIMHFGFLFI